MFTALTVISLLVLAVAITYKEYVGGASGASRLAFRQRIAHYLPYLSARLKTFVKSIVGKGLKSFSVERIVSNNRGWEGRILYGLYGSSIYLILSGFLSAFFFPRGLSGLPLFLHVVSGGVFAVCLTAAIYVKAKDYTFHTISSFQNKDLAEERNNQEEMPSKVKLLFWIIAVSGLSLITTALASMLSFFPSTTQFGLLVIHRYSALIGLLSTIAFIHFSSIGKTQ